MHMDMELFEGKNIALEKLASFPGSADIYPQFTFHLTYGLPVHSPHLTIKKFQKQFQ